jgi:hypothetical protein
MASAPPVPQPVLDAATRHRLGGFVATCHGPNNGQASMTLLKAGPILLLVSAGLFAMGSWTGMGLFYGLGVTVLILGVVCLLQALKFALKRRPEYFLFDAGLVERKGARAQAVGWSEIQSVTRRRTDKAAMGRIGVTPDMVGQPDDLQLGYDVRLRDGGSLFVQVGNSIPEHVRFSTAFERLAVPAGITISG